MTIKTNFKVDVYDCDVYLICTAKSKHPLIDVVKNMIKKIRELILNQMVFFIVLRNLFIVIIFGLILNNITTNTVES